MEDMSKLFVNDNGQVYAIVKGEYGKMALLVNLKREQYVVCAVLEKSSWNCGEYFTDFDEAYNYYKNNEKRWR